MRPLQQSQRELSHTCTCCSSCECSGPHHRTVLQTSPTLNSLASNHQFVVVSHSKIHSQHLKCQVCLHTACRHLLSCRDNERTSATLLQMNGYWKQWWHSSKKGRVALYQCQCQWLTPFSSALPHKGLFMSSDANTSVCSCTRLCWCV